MGKWVENRGIRVWLDDEGKAVICAHCRSCGVPAYYEYWYPSTDPEVYHIPTYWCWRHAPKDAEVIPVE